jgi:hypothetical protein
LYQKIRKSQENFALGGCESQWGSEAEAEWAFNCQAQPTGAGKQKASSGDGLGAEEVFEEEAGEAAGLVADDGVFLEEVVEDDAEAELLKRG